MNDFTDDLLAALAPIVRELEFLGVSYYVAGSVASSNKVDVFAVKDRDYDRVAMQRIRKDSLDRDRPSEEYFQAAPEDIVLNKLEWFRHYVRLRQP